MYIVLSLFSIFIFSSLLKFAFYYLPKNYYPLYSFLLFVTGSISYILTNYSETIKLFFYDMNKINAETIIDIFIPLLIFNSSFNLNFHVFWNIKHIALSLAFPLLSIIAGLYSITYYGIFGNNHYDLFIPILIKGFILSATDPVAIVASMKHMNAQKPLEMIIEGESLLNDGVSIFLFSFFLDIYKNDLSTSEGFKDFFFSIILSPIIGIIFGFIVRKLLGHTRKDPMIEYSIVLSIAYFNCVLLETIEYGLSGVLSTVAYGMYLSYKGKYNMSPEIEKTSETIFNFLAEMLEVIIFFLSGYICLKNLWENYTSDILYKIMVSYLLINIYRIIIVTLSYFLFRKNEYNLSLKSFLFIGCCAVRGAITLSMGLLLHKIPDTSEHWQTEFMIIIFGVVVLSFLINGLLVIPLYKYLRLNKRNFFDKNDYLKLKSHLNRITNSKIEDLKNSVYHKNTEWTKIYATMFFGKYNESRSEWDEESSPSSERYNFQITLSNHHNNFLHSVYHQYWVEFEAERINKIAITYLLEAVEHAFDHCERDTEGEFDILQYEYDYLSKLFDIPRYWDNFNQRPMIGKIFYYKIYNRLYLCYRVMEAFIDVHKIVCDKYANMGDNFSREYRPFIRRYEEKFEHKLSCFGDRYPVISREIFSRETMKVLNHCKKEEIDKLLCDGLIPQKLGKKFYNKIQSEHKMIKVI